MNIKSDDVLMCLRTLGFRCEEKTAEGFLRYQKRIGNLLVTVANGQFENKIRISMLQDCEGNIRTSYKDIMAYTDVIADMMMAGLIQEESVAEFQAISKDNMIHDDREEFDEMENPLIGLPRKPKGFMAQ